MNLQFGVNRRFGKSGGLSGPGAGRRGRRVDAPLTTVADRRTLGDRGSRHYTCVVGSAARLPGPLAARVGGTGAPN